MGQFIQNLTIENLILFNEFINNSNRDEILIKIAEELRVKLKTQKLTDKFSVELIFKILEDGDQARKRQDQELLRGDLPAFDAANEVWTCLNVEVCQGQGQNDTKSVNVHGDSQRLSTSTRSDFPASDAVENRGTFEMDDNESNDSDCTILMPHVEPLKPVPKQVKIVPLPEYLKRVENWAANLTTKRKRLIEDVEYFRNNKRHLVYQVQNISKTFYSCKWHKEIPNKIRKGTPSQDFKRRCRDLFNKYPPQPQNVSFSSQHNNSNNLKPASTLSPTPAPTAVPFKVEKMDSEGIMCAPFIGDYL